MRMVKKQFNLMTAREITFRSSAWSKIAVDTTIFFFLKDVLLSILNTR